MSVMFVNNRRCKKSYLLIEAFEDVVLMLVLRQ